MSEQTVKLALAMKLIQRQRDSSFPIWRRLNASWKEYLNGCGDAMEARPLPLENRGSWFCPVVAEVDARKIRSIAKKHGIKRIYDMGAGDLRLSYWLAEQGFDVVAYETIPDYPRYAMKTLGKPSFRLKMRDYYLDFPELVKENHVLFCFMGGTNKPPSTEQGLVVEGYWEIGSRFWENGRLADYW